MWQYLFFLFILLFFPFTSRKRNKQAKESIKKIMKLFVFLAGVTEHHSKYFNTWEILLQCHISRVHLSRYSALFLKVQSLTAAKLSAHKRIQNKAENSTKEHVFCFYSKEILRVAQREREVHYRSISTITLYITIVKNKWKILNGNPPQIFNLNDFILTVRVSEYP